MNINVSEKCIDYNNNIFYESGFYDIRHIRPHYHYKDMEIVFCLKGHVNLVAGHQSVRVNAGEVFSIDCRDIHYIYSDTANLTLLFHLDLTKTHIPWEKLQNIFFSCESCHCYPYQQRAMNMVKDIILTLSFISCSHSDIEIASREKEINKLLCMFIDIMYKYFNWFNYENQDEYVNDEMLDRFYRIISFCSENYYKKITISQLAAAEHIDKNYFSQYISKTVFSNFNAMISFIRCYEAEHLLLTTDKPNWEISYLCGFSDSKYFYRAFKSWWKSTPTEHRKRYDISMKKNNDVTKLTGEQAVDLLRDYITKWHMEKTFGQIS